jgi:hypothetical protein
MKPLREGLSIWRDPAALGADFDMRALIIFNPANGTHTKSRITK